MANFTTVFLSSTAKDLQRCRDAVHAAISGMDGYHCVRMEDFGARDRESDEFCREKVAECDVFVGLIGHLHGSRPEGSERSYTEREYEAAQESGKPRLLFLATADFRQSAPLARESEFARSRQEGFRERVARDRIVESFSDPDGLGTAVVSALRNLEHERAQRKRLKLSAVVGCLILLAISLGLLLLRPIAPSGQHSTVPAVPATTAVDTGGLDRIEEAKRLIQEQHEYDQARSYLLGIRGTLSPEKRYEAEGLLLATYYGKRQDREGLTYVCSLYTGHPRDDVRFRFQIQAFLRRIALKEGFTAAEGQVSELRRDCDRVDLSYVWAGIPLAKAEFLHQGLTSEEERRPLRESDRAYLEYVAARYPDDSFRDHALYFLGRYEEVLSEYPRSTIRDVVLRSAAARERSKGHLNRALEFLGTALKEFPGSVRVIDDLAVIYKKKGDKNALFELRKQYLFSSDEIILHSLGQRLPLISPEEVRAALSLLARREGELTRFRGLFENNCGKFFRFVTDDLYAGRYEVATRKYREVSDAFSRFGIPAPTCIRRGLDILEGISGKFQHQSAAELFTLGFFLRDHSAEVLGDAAFREVAANVWVLCEGKSHGTKQGEKAFYLAAALRRRMAEYTKAADLFRKLAQQYPHGDLADDALTEVGWYYLFVEEDGAIARSYFERVVKEYPSSNAMDNALNWLALSYYYERRFDKALATYRRIPSGRIGIHAAKMVACLRPVVASAKPVRDIEGLELASKYEVPGGLYVQSVSRGSAADKAGLRKGDLITAAEGKAIASPGELRDLMNVPANLKSIELDVRRGKKDLVLRPRLTRSLKYEDERDCLHNPAG